MRLDRETARRAGEINRLRKERRAIILAHFYQRPEVQEVADFVGDSLQLAQQAAKSEAPVIVLCGVHFMAESAALLNPGRLVLLPEEQAGCSMADMVTVEGLRRCRREHPEALVVSYVNTSAAVKAESDICCTSANAERVVCSLPPEREVIFVPDQNLAGWVERRTGRKIIPWPGHCFIHHQLTAEEVREKRRQHPGAKLLVHPECRPEVTELADGVLSTAGMLRYAQSSSAAAFIIGTEEGLLHQLRRAC
ncbi:MAG: quinolinate synthase NadA, partial [Syntrophomonadaceae bacterium]|nr:quinolinate synthase NadA [Syntrophomonadaceae bacterium]